MQLRGRGGRRASTPTISSLLDKSLFTAPRRRVQPPFWLLETLRQFAADRLDATCDDRDAMRDAHVEWFYASRGAGVRLPLDGYTWACRCALEEALSTISGAVA